MKQQDQSLLLNQNFFKKFYIEKTFSLTNGIDKPLWFGQVLIFMKFVQYWLILIPPSIKMYFLRIYNKNIIDQLNYSYLIFSVVINSLILFILITNLIFQNLKVFFQNTKNLSNILLFAYSNAFTLSFIACSIIFSDNHLVLSIFIITSTILISIFCVHHDYDLRYTNVNSLQIRDAFYSQWLLIFDLAQISQSYLFNESNSMIITLLLFLLKLFYEIGTINYLNKNIFQLNVNLTLITIYLFAANLILKKTQLFPDTDYSIYFLTLLIIPISFKQSQLISVFYIQRNKEKAFKCLEGNVSETKQDLSILDYYLRYLHLNIHSHQDELVNSRFTILFKHLLIYHQKNGCNSYYKKCFCQMVILNEQIFKQFYLKKEKDISNEKENKIEALTIICDAYKQKFNKQQKLTQNHIFNYGFLFFVLDVLKNSQYCILLSFIMRENLQYRNSLLEQQKFYQLQKIHLPAAQKQFELERYAIIQQKTVNSSLPQKKTTNNITQDQQEIDDKKDETNESNSTISSENEKQYYQEDDNQLLLLQIIQIEETQNKANSQLLQCLVLKLNILNILLFLNKIDLKQFYENLIELKQQINLLKNTLTKLIIQNPFNPFFIQMIDVIESTLCCDNSLSTFQKKMKIRVKNPLQNDHINSIITAEGKQRSQEGCIIFITILGRCPGIIKKASKNYSQVLGWKKTQYFERTPSNKSINKSSSNSTKMKQAKSIIGQNIGIIIPPQIAVAHDQFLQNYLVKMHDKSAQDQISSSENRNFIGIDVHGWAIPYLIQFQITFLSQQEIGICARIQREINIEDCIVFSRKNFEIYSLSQNFTKIILNRTKPINSNEFPYLKITHYIIGIQEFIKTKTKEFKSKQFESVVVASKDPLSFEFDQFLSDENSDSYFSKFNFYSMNSILQGLKNNLIDIVQMKILSLVRLDKISAHEQIQQILSKYDTNNVINSITLQQKKGNLCQQILVPSQNISLTNQDPINTQSYHIPTIQNTQDTQQNLHHTRQNKKVVPNNNFQTIPSTKNINSTIQTDILISQNAIGNIFNQPCNYSNFPTNSKNNPTFITNKTNILDFAASGNTPIFTSNSLQLTNDNIQAQSTNTANKTIYNEQLNKGNTVDERLDNFFTEKNQKFESVQITNSQSFNDQIQFSLINTFRYGEIEKEKSTARTIDFNLLENQDISKISASKLINSTSQHNLIDDQKIYEAKRNSINSKEDTSGMNQKHHKNEDRDCSQQTDDPKEILAQQSEARSRLTEITYQKHRSLVQNIHSKSKLFGLLVIQYLGYGILLIIATVSIYNYFRLDSEYSSQSNQIVNLDWPSQVRNSLLQFVVDLNMLRIVDNSIAKQQLFQGVNQNIFHKNITKQLNSQHTLLKGYIVSHLEVIYSNKDIENLILEKFIDFQFLNITSGPSSISYQRLEYIIYLLYAGSQYVANRTNIGVNDDQLVINYSTMAVAYDQVSDWMESDIKIKFDGLDVISNLSFFLILSFSIIFYLFLIFMFSYVSKVRSKILKYASSFSPQSIEMMIKQINVHYIQLFKDASEEDRQKKFFQTFASKASIRFQADQSKKRRGNMIHIIPLKKYNFIMITASLLCISLLQTYTFANLILVNKLLLRLSANREILNKVTSEQYIVNESVGFITSLLNLRLTDQNSEFNLEFYKDLMSIETIKGKIMEINKIYSKQDSIDRANKDDYMTYLNGVYKYDACQYTYDHKDLFTNGFNITDCYLNKYNLFSKGIMQGITYFYEVLDNEFSAFVTADKNELIQKQVWLNTFFNLEDINRFRTNLQNIFSGIKRYTRNEIITEYAQKSDINYQLFIIQMIFTFIIFFFVWTSYFQSISNLYHSTKQSLDIFDIFSLVANPYLYQYLKEIK